MEEGKRGSVERPDPLGINSDNLLPAPTSKDWPEDYSGENGCYQNRCVYCKSKFYGHKLRAVCKECYHSVIIE